MMSRSHTALWSPQAARTLVVVLLAVVVVVAQTTNIQLNIPLTSPEGCGAGSVVPQWLLHNANGSISDVPSCLPGNVYTHLHDAGVLPQSPLFRYNDMNYRWVAYDNWTYTLAMPLNAFFANITANNGSTAVRVELFAHAVRVFSHVKIATAPTGSVAPLNWISVGNTSSQFLEYSWDVTAILSSALTQCAQSTGSWTMFVLLSFTSTVLEAVKRNNEYPLSPVPVAPPYLEGLPSRNFVRTEQSSFGWDWGPAFAPVGIDGSMALQVTLNDAAADYSTTSQRVVRAFPQVMHVPTTPGAYNVFKINITLEVEVYSTSSSGGPCMFSASPCTSSASIFVYPSNITWMNETFIENNVTVTPSRCGVGYCWTGYTSVVLFVENPELWWPRGYGSQPLYPIAGVFSFIGSVDAYWSLPPLAIRAIALITKGNPQASSPSPPLTYAPPEVVNPTHIAEHSMYFQVNGVPVFAKGSNVIPASAFPGPSDKPRLIRDLQSAIAANMNMVRVWGGGYYKADWFYEFCDANGLLVWQEIMFACAEYPVDTDFIAAVTQEVEEQVQRLSRFSSIILWSANNENDIFDYGSEASAYHELYTETVMNTIVRFDRSRPMWPSSPSEGFISGVDANGLPNGDVIIRDKNTTKPGDTPRGDAHYYNYFSCPDFLAYPRTHFASEFGFQSLPWEENIAPVSSEADGDWSLNSIFMNHRQHHPQGNAEIAQLIIQNFFPPNTTVQHIFNLPFNRSIFLSQLQQLLCIADQASFYRRGRDYPTFRTMGSLYWQLNQNWQAPSWTSLEFGGQWKALHYAMRATYQDLHLSTFFDPNTSMAYVHLANDGFAPLERVFTKIHLVRVSDATSVLLPNNNNASTPCYDTWDQCTSALDWVPNQGGTFLWSGDVTALMNQYSFMCPTVNDCFLWAAAYRSMGPNMVVDVAQGQPLFLSPLGNMSWGPGRQDPVTPPQHAVQVTVTSVAANEATIEISLKSSFTGVALFVFIRSPKYPLGQFSSNLLHLISCASPPFCPGQQSTMLYFTNTDGPIESMEVLQGNLVVEIL